MCVIGPFVDISAHLNELIYHLQGKYQLLHALYDSIKGFQTKLTIWERNLKANNNSHVPTLGEVYGSGEHNSEKYTNGIGTLIEESNDRFSDFKARKRLIK
jgi:hypothetical protein